ncbi:MAG: tetratricopeptide repeat protein [Halanaerobium sp.]|nr:tetratricopeptide repeat protein [Halanaerobium sp.]
MNCALLNCSLSNIRRLILSLLILVILFTAPQVEAGYQEGREAFYIGDYEQVITELEPFVSENPAHLNATYLLGLAYYRLDNLEEAEKYLRSAHQLAPDSIAVVNNLARVFRDRGNTAEGIAILNQFLVEQAIGSDEEVFKDTDGLAQTYNILGTLYLNEADYRQAVEFLQKAVELDESNYYAWNNLGLAFLKQGEYAQALEPLERAVSQEPVVPYIYNNFGVVLENLGQYERAAEAYNRALEIDPDYQKAAANLTRVESKGK